VETNRFAPSDAEVDDSPTFSVFPGGVALPKGLSFGGLPNAKPTGLPSVFDNEAPKRGDFVEPEPDPNVIGDGFEGVENKPEEPNECVPAVPEDDEPLTAGGTFGSPVGGLKENAPLVPKPPKADVDVILELEPKLLGPHDGNGGATDVVPSNLTGEEDAESGDVPILEPSDI
jgi:hypothetical protein